MVLDSESNAHKLRRTSSEESNFEYALNNILKTNLGVFVSFHAESDWPSRSGMSLMSQWAVPPFH